MNIQCKGCPHCYSNGKTLSLTFQGAHYHLHLHSTFLFCTAGIFHPINVKIIKKKSIKIHRWPHSSRDSRVCVPWWRFSFPVALKINAAPSVLCTCFPLFTNGHMIKRVGNCFIFDLEVPWCIFQTLQAFFQEHAPCNSSLPQTLALLGSRCHIPWKSHHICPRCCLTSVKFPATLGPWALKYWKTSYCLAPLYSWIKL